MNSSTVLITGGAGFVGSCLVRQFVAADTVYVINLDLLTYAGNLAYLGEANSSPRHTFIHGDICDAALVKELLEKHRPSAVIHLAAESHVDRSIAAPRTFAETNILGTVTLLEETHDYWKTFDRAERETFRFLHVSTDEVYGSIPEDQFVSESAPYAPNSPYSASKAASNHLVRAFHQTYGLPTLTVNSSNNYGPCQNPEKLIPAMILRAVHNKPLPLYGDGLHVRDWLYVEDHVRAILLVLEKGKIGEVYNIGGNNLRTNREVVEQICDILDLIRASKNSRRELITFVADRPGHDRRYALDSHKALAELGWSLQMDFDDGLELTVRWYLEKEHLFDSNPGISGGK